MDISILDVIGPVMIGPSSSHTAGAARLSRTAAAIVGKPFHKVVFGLHGSFAKTYKGHGTDIALLAGAMGIREDDEQLSKAFDLADGCGLSYSFEEIELEGVHENSVCMTFYCDDGDPLAAARLIFAGLMILKQSLMPTRRRLLSATEMKRVLSVRLQGFYRMRILILR